MKLCILTTGGTIACRAGADGLAPAIRGDELIAKVPELEGLAEYEVFELMQLDSTNITSKDWKTMAHAIKDHRASCDAFLITHGTDTMAYTAAALSEMLVNLDCPVILTGSMQPLEAVETDAKDNLLLAVHAAVEAVKRHIHGVYVAFYDRIFLGTNVTKFHSHDEDAFETIADEPVAYWTEDGLDWDIEFLSTLSPASGALTIRDKLEERVVCLKLLPSTPPEVLTALVDAGFRGILIAGYGTGGVPKRFLPALDYAKEHGTLVVGTTQCYAGGVDFDSYENGVLAARHGMISGDDAATELLTIRLMLKLGEKL